MNDSLVYNVPVGMVEAYQGHRLVVRSSAPEMIVRKLADQNLETLEYIQILGTGGSIAELTRWRQPVPVDIQVEHIEADLPRLYHYAPMRADRPVRVSVPVKPGFGRMVKLALSLDFAVQMSPCQPEPHLTEELLRVADLYLHRSTVSQPIEFIHSVFLAFFHGSRISLWTVLEEDPSRNRYVTEEGGEAISRRLATSRVDLAAFPGAFSRDLLEEKRECLECPFFDFCGGYFKWPDRDYRCDGPKALFQTLYAAAEELKADLSSLHSVREKD